jgi:hypothetical protein
LFVEVANTRNFSKAALALGMPVSTVSRRIGALEKELLAEGIWQSSSSIFEDSNVLESFCPTGKPGAHLTGK